VTAGIPIGAALWFRGDTYHGSEELFARITVPTPGDALGSDSARRFWSSVARLEEIHAHEVPGSHWYLPFLGVEPEHQRRGLGGALLHAMIERAARERLACYLESFQPRNIEFYRRHGFGLVAHEIEPVSRLPFWTFRLDP
jgi:ribosomal protein S18 acetylase RimI-like enzyme